MSLLTSAARRLTISGELLRFFWQDSKWWFLTPVIFLLLMFVVVLFLAQASPLAPFLYRLF